MKMFGAGLLCVVANMNRAGTVFTELDLYDSEGKIRREVTSELPETGVDADPSPRRHARRPDFGTNKLAAQ